MNDLFGEVWCAKLDSLRASGVDPYPSNLAVTHQAASLHARFLDVAEPSAEADAGPVTVGGRLMFRNLMGKAAFLRVQDGSGVIQLWAKIDTLGEAAFAIVKGLDIGDIVWATGRMMRTRTGELTVAASEVRLAGKALMPFPDRWNSVTDIEKRSRQRHVDLFMNEDSRDAFAKRSRVMRWLRDFLDERGFVEVETPMMHPIPGGAAARPFQTHHNALDLELYLRIAPELYLKRLVVGGMEAVYEVNRNFRNEGVDSRHNPEFTMLELYRTWSTYADLITLTEQMFVGLVDSVCGTRSLTFGPHTLNFEPPYRVTSMASLVSVAIGLHGAALRDPEALATAWGDRPCGARRPTTYGAWWELIFGELVEHTLVDPTFVTGFPISISPLSRRSDADPDTAERFELYVAGMELANGFSELNDPIDQAARFAAQAAQRVAGDRESMWFDADYVRALGSGMPPTAGEGIGIDRLVMLLTGRTSIRDVILFPLLRPEAG